MKKDITYLKYGKVLMVCVFTLFSFTGRSIGSPDGGSSQDERITGYGPHGTQGSVMIKGLELKQADHLLHFSFEVWIDRYAINYRQSWNLVPELYVAETDLSMELPTLIITGRQKERHLKRKERFGNTWLMDHYPDYHTAIPHGTDTVIIYRAMVPYENWMDHAQLNIHQYLASPKEKRQLFSSDGYGMVELEPFIPTPIKPIVTYGTPDREIKKRSDTSRALIDFPVNVSTILPDFRRNFEELNRIDRQLRLINDNPYITVEAIFMEGYASPEGSGKLNERLARERVEALKRYFVEQHSIRPDIIHTRTNKEDWTGLRAAIDNWDEKMGRERILSVIDSPDDPEMKERRLRAMPEWKKIVSQVLPPLRRTEYRIDFRVSDFTPDQSRSLISLYPELFSHYELYMLARSYDNDPVKRLEIFEMIVRQYPDDDLALNNYAAALIENQETLTARRYLERMKDKSAAANNLGVVHLIEGNYSTAEQCFLFSSDPESDHNLGELTIKMQDEILLKRYQNR